jgi:hypothetical protein
MVVTESNTARFWARVAKGDGCWSWTGGTNRNGYGTLHMGGHTIRKPWRAHRFSWVLHNGPIPDGLWVLHKCDNPPCCNPAHLFLGDRRANMLDAAAKGRICNVGRSRLTHCKRGHEFTSENTRLYDGHRYCKQCDRLHKRNSRARLRAIRTTPGGNDER